MQLPQLHDCLMAKPGAAYSYQPDWHWHRYYAADKMYAALCMDDQERLTCVTIKLPVEEGELLRAQHPQIKPGYYMNKQHWNTVWLNDPVPDELLLTMLEHGYQNAFQALSKKKQQLILNQ